MGVYIKHGLYYYVSILWKVVEHICLKNHLFTTHNGVRQVKTDKEGFKSFNLQNKYYITYACTYDKITLQILHYIYIIYNIRNEWNMGFSRESSDN